MREALKSFVRRFVTGRTLTRRLPASVGRARILVSPESQLKHLRPGRAGFDRLLLSWAETLVQPGTVVWDIGANVGAFAFAAAGRAARVLAVEADPYMSSLLLRSKQLNPSLRVDVIAAAISDRSGLATLNIASGGRAANALAPFAGQHMPFGETLVGVDVATVTLDALLERYGAPDLVKIDIEGAELLALSGAHSVLRDARPTLIVETSNETKAAITSLLASLNYELSDAETGAAVESCASNTLAIPR